MPTESDKLLKRLKAWADKKSGRRSEIARTIGVSRQTVTNWLAGRRNPTLEDGLKIQVFLSKR